jgi:hypothetical protein
MRRMEERHKNRQKEKNPFQFFQIGADWKKLKPVQ